VALDLGNTQVSVALNPRLGDSGAYIDPKLGRPLDEVLDEGEQRIIGPVEVLETTTRGP
jgi:hypothetical protein